MTTYDYHIRYVHRACLEGSGRNSYQASCIESGEFWRVLGRPRVRRQWKRDIVDTFTHHFCANGHGGTIGTGFPYIRRVDRRTLAPVQYIVPSSLLHWQSLLYSLQPSSQPFYKVSIRPSLLRDTLRNTTLNPQLRLTSSPHWSARSITPEAWCEHIVLLQCRVVAL